MTNKINIKDLLPLLKDGYVAMDMDGTWFWYSEKPERGDIDWYSEKSYVDCLSMFNIKSVKDWEKSLIKCDQLPKTSDSNANVFNIAFDKGWNAGWNAHCEKCVNDIRG